MGKKQIPLTSFTPVSLVTQMSKSCWGKVSNLFFPSENLLSYDKGKEVGRGEKESWEKWGKKGKKKEGREEKRDGQLYPWWRTGKYPDSYTPCGQNLCFLLQIFPTQGSNPGLQHCKQMLYRLSEQGKQ